MKSVNRVTLVGHLGRDPEIKNTTSGKVVARFSLATDFFSKPNGNGGYRRITEWHDVTVWEKLAVLAGQKLHKGSKVYLEGRIETRSWDDKQTGQKRYAKDIIAHELIVLDVVSSNGNGSAEVGEQEIEEEFA